MTHSEDNHPAEPATPIGRLLAVRVELQPMSIALLRDLPVPRRRRLA
jgi:hypothetical protein